MAKSKVDPEEVAVLHDDGWSVDDIAKQLGISRRWVYVNLHRAGWEAPPEPANKCPEASTLRSLYLDRGFTAAKLAKIFKVNIRTVTRWLTRHGITRRKDD